jgi:hypothetical protein
VAISREPATSTWTWSPWRANAAATSGSRKNGCFSEPITPRATVSAGARPAATRSRTEETIATPTPTARTAASARLRARLTGTSTRGGEW